MSTDYRLRSTAMKFRFEDLHVWQDARNFINQIYTLTKKFPTSEKFALIDQLRRAAVSIALNITEGSDRKSDIEFSRYLRMAITSTEEVVTALYIALDQKYISQSDFDTLYKEAHMIVAKLNALIKSLRSTDYSLPQKNSSRKTVDSRHQRGFTLVELLIAISIIAVLSVVGLTTFSGIQSKARDAVRKNDLNILATALAIYREQNGKYVVQSSGTDITSCPSSSDTTSTFYTLIEPNLSTPAPKDPKTGSFYCYISVNTGQSFRLFATLENCSGSSGNLCGDTSYNHTVFSEDLSLASAPSGTADLTPISTSTPTQTPIPTSTPTTSTFVQLNVGCSNTSGLNPDQMCIRQGYARAAPVRNDTVAKGYWWKECGGASISNCSGLDCTVDNLDCTNTPGVWGSQQPYPSQYTREGNNTTVYTPGVYTSCDGNSPGWTMRVYCSNSTSTPIASTSPTPSIAACADGTNDQVYSTSMVGCNGSVNWTNKGALCTAGSHVCSFAEYAARGGSTTQPTQTRWLSDTSSQVSGASYPCISTFCGGTICYRFPPGSYTGLLAKGSTLISYSSSCSDISANNVGYVGFGGLTFYDASGTTCCN